MGDDTVMRMSLRIIVSLVAGLLGAALAFGLVALAFHAAHLDPGIGGGLIAMAAAILAVPCVGVFVFLRLAKPSSVDRDEQSGS